MGGWRSLLFCLCGLLALLTGCMRFTAIRPEVPPALYRTPIASSLAARHAPAFLVHSPDQECSRMGSPVATPDAAGSLRLAMDTAAPVVYVEERTFAAQRGRYTNLIYRVHFACTPVSLVPFLLGAGRNMGLLVVVTLDGQGQPVLVTTAGTCGCYAASSATDGLEPAARPDQWTGAPLQLYGETLPALLPVAELKAPRLVVEVRPGEHRVMGLRMVEAATLEELSPWLVETRLAPVEELERVAILVDGQRVGETSLFYPRGFLAGQVKGAWKPWETLFLGLISLDPVVGMDKAYGWPGNPFYTSLKPWNRQASDLNDFPGFLRFNGWRL